MKNYILLFALIISINSYAQKETNFDESKIPKYKLPELLISEKGEIITDAKSWMEKRRPEILSQFEENIYGKIPGKLEGTFKVIDQSNNGLGGKAIRKQVVLTYKNNGKEINLNLLIFLPKTSQKVPMVIGLNFWGNQTLVDDTAIVISKGTSRGRGVGKMMLPVERLIDSGYGLATIYMGDMDPDKQGEPDFSDGVHPLLYKENQTRPYDNEWGAIAAWSWGLCKAMDYFETDKDIDSKKVAVFGHSRLGKAALWAGATDERFALVISNNSGCGGAALSRRQFGERLGEMNNQFKQWLCQNSRKFDWNEEALPVDQHELIALIAPRPVYVASAEEDLWADPKGEFLSAYHATPVYELFGKKGMASDKMPKINQPVMTSIGYHIRTGKHGALAYDWDQYIKFADMHLKKGTALISTNLDCFAQYRPSLFFREDWKENPAAHPVTQEHVANPDLILKLHGPGHELIRKSHHEKPADDPFYIWSGYCNGNWAVSLSHKNYYADLSGFAKIRWRSKQSGLRNLHLLLKLADGQWLVSDQYACSSMDWRIFEFNIQEIRWFGLDIHTVIEGKPVENPDLSKVDEIGFTDLMTGGSGTASSRLDWIEVDGKQVKKSGGKVTAINFEKFDAKQEFTMKDWNNDNNIKVAWTNGFEQARAIIDDAVSHSGKQSLRILFPAEGVGPRQSGAQAPIQLPPSDEYYVSYWMRFSDNFKWGGSQFYGGKLPGLAAGKGCSGCETCDGTNGFTARLMWGKEGRLVLYLYHMDKKNRCGDSHDLLDENKMPFMAKKGEWIHVAERVKVNSLSNHDGEVQLWLNGVEAIHKTGIKFVTNGDKVDLFYFSTFFGGSEPGYRPGEDCHIWFDDIKISTNQLDVL